MAPAQCNPFYGSKNINKIAQTVLNCKLKTRPLHTCRQIVFLAIQSTNVYFTPHILPVSLHTSAARQACIVTARNHHALTGVIIPRHVIHSLNIQENVMKSQKLKRLPFYLTILLSALLYMTCGTQDDRDRIRAQMGEPDSIITRGADPFWRETWYYDQAGVAYEFRRTAGCGGSGDVYLNFQYFYAPQPDSLVVPTELPLKTNPIDIF